MAAISGRITLGIDEPRRLPRAELTALLALLVFSLLCFSIFPVGFYGNGYDDQRYAHAAVRWLQSFPFVGTTHWELRHPFNLLLALGFYLFGVTQETIEGFTYAIDIALLIVTYLGVRAVLGWATAFLACVLLVAMPVVAQGAVGVEFMELLFVAASFWSLMLAAKTDKNRWIVASGLCLGLAWEVRETSAALVLLYAISFFFFPLIQRKKYVLLAAIAAIPVLLEEVFYVVLTGDPLYRFHVDSNHIHVASAHMIGRISNQAMPFFNLEVAKSWLSADDFLPGNWLTYPYESLFLDPFTGPVLLLSLVGFGLWLASGRAGLRTPLGMLALGGLLWFVVATYVLMLRPGSGYYAFTAYGAVVFTAAAILQLWQGNRRVLGGALLALILIANIAALPLARRNDGAFAAIQYLRSHKETVFVSQKDMQAFDIDVRDASLLGRVRTRPEKGVPALHFEASVEACPAQAAWCAKSNQTLLAETLDGFGISKHVPARLLNRLKSGRTGAYLMFLYKSL